MSTRPTSSGASLQRDPRLARHISATWWYTVAGVLFWQAPLVLAWVAMLLHFGYDARAAIVVGAGGALWIAASVPLVLAYRHHEDDPSHVQRRVVVVPMVIGLVYGMAILLVTGIGVLAAVPVLQNLVLFHWSRGVRLRVVLTVTLLLVALWVVDSRVSFAHLSGDDSTVWWVVGVFTISQPPMTALSLWWWDVLVSLNRARAAEARLGAMQERLRVATDVHDLQGHHLQVIALQLELAERLMPTDPSASLERLRTARASVDAARQGTRDLATRFRSVPLGDEIANAVDLLRAAGTTTKAFVDPGADRAPADVLGPVIRETTTNALRHGAGTWARLALTREGHAWRYEISNDRAEDARNEGSTGSGLEGIGRRVREAGGSTEVRRGGGDFTVVVTVPEGGAQ